jgi:hypothetical protein
MSLGRSSGTSPPRSSSFGAIPRFSIAPRQCRGNVKQVDAALRHSIERVEPLTAGARAAPPNTAFRSMLWSARIQASSGRCSPTCSRRSAALALKRRLR